MDAVSAPAVSVIIPCHNAALFLADALQSVRDQTLRDLECIVIDDASADGSKSVAERFIRIDSRFKLIETGKPEGASAARNAGIMHATGRWLALLDADDLFVPDRLEILTRIGDAMVADLVFDDQLITEYPKTVSAHRAFGFARRQFEFSQEDFFSGARLFRRSFPTGYMKPLIRSDFLSNAGVAYDPAVPSGEDFLFYAQLFAERPRCISTSFAGYVYRRRRGSLSRSEEHLHFHAELGERVLDELRRRLSSSSRSALAGRRRDFDTVAQAMPALAALRRREWTLLARLLTEQPRVAGTCLRLVKTRAMRSCACVKFAIADWSKRRFRSR